MVRNRGLGKFHRGSSMRIRDRTQRRIADWREIGFERGVFPELIRVVKAQTHDEIVWMLRVCKRLPVRSLAGLKQERIAAIGDPGGLQAQHQVSLKSPAGGGPMRRPN